MTDNPQDTENQYGGRMGPGPMYVTITSADGHEFIMKRKYAEASDTLVDMITGIAPTTAEDEPLYLDLGGFQSHVLQKACMYLIYKVCYTNSTTAIPVFPIAPEMSLELVEVAIFLKC